MSRLGQVISLLTEQKALLERIAVAVEKKPKKASKGNPELELEIYNHWNSKTGKPWHKHRSKEPSPEIRQAIRARLKTYSVDVLKSAIDNYHQVLTDKKSFWTMKWNLRNFLMIHKPNERTELQLWRWLPSTFDMYDYLTPAERKRRAMVKRIVGEKESAKPVEVATPEQRRQIREAIFKKEKPVQDMSIAEIRDKLHEVF